MYSRSEIRHACYRAKNNAITDDKLPMIAMVEPKIPKNESWQTFAIDWDILLDKEGNVSIVKPETDYDFIHATCIEYALLLKNKIKINFGEKQQNVIDIVELNMLDNMEWSTYNKNWGVYVDYDLKQIHTKHFKTVVNEVPAPRIEEPREIIEPPSITINEFEVVSGPERKKLEKMLNLKGR